MPSLEELYNGPGDLCWVSPSVCPTTVYDPLGVVGHGAHCGWSLAWMTRSHRWSQFGRCYVAMISVCDCTLGRQRCEQPHLLGSPSLPPLPSTAGGFNSSFITHLNSKLPCSRRLAAPLPWSVRWRRIWSSCHESLVRTVFAMRLPCAMGD